MTLELLEDAETSAPAGMLLRRIESIFRLHVNAGEFDDARELVERLQQIAERSPHTTSRDALQQSLLSLAAPDTVGDLVTFLQTAPAEKIPSIENLIKALGAPVRRNLLVALAEEENRSRRRRLFDFIASLGPSMIPDIVGFLSDARWYVVRNMIVLLRAMHDRSSLPQLRELAHHRDLRVKFEALKSLFALEPESSAALLDEVLSDPDPKVVDTATTLVGSYGIKEGVGPLLRILKGNDVLGARRSLRLKALRSLGELGDPRALGDLQRFFEPSLLPWPSRQERQVAWESLQKYPAEARMPFVEKGLRSRDPHVRAICKSLSRIG